MVAPQSCGIYRASRDIDSIGAQQERPRPLAEEGCSSLEFYDWEELAFSLLRSGLTASRMFLVIHRTCPQRSPSLSR